MTDATRPYAWVLERIALSIRSDWGKPPYLGDLRAVLADLDDIDPDLLAGPLMRFCTESTAISPLEFKGRGAWWLNKFPRISSTLPPRIRPMTDTERAEQAEVNRRGLEKVRQAAAAALARNPQPQSDQGEVE